MVPSSNKTQIPEDKVVPTRSSRLEFLIAVAIAVVSLSTAVAAWRMSDLGSQAGDAEWEGLALVWTGSRLLG